MHGRKRIPKSERIEKTEGEINLEKEKLGYYYFILYV